MILFPVPDGVFTVFMVINACLATADFFLVVGGMVLTWSRGAADYRIRHLGMAVILFAVMYGNIEALILDVPPGPRVFLFTLGLLWILVAYLLPDRYRQFSRRHPADRSH